MKTGLLRSVRLHASLIASLIAMLLSLCAGIWVPVAAEEPDTILIGKHAEWKFFANQDNPPAEWNRASFHDGAWKRGVAGFGYGDADDRTVLEDMRGRYRTVYIRRMFDLGDNQDVPVLYLYLRFDDGFIAYLNGQQVASKSLARTDRGLRIDHHEANGYEEFVIRDLARILRPGENLIAIEGHNVALESSDFSLDPVLSKRRLDDVEGRFSVKQYLQDLDEFQRRLLDQSSYLTRLDFDYETALKRLRSSIDEETRLSDFVCDLHKMVMQIGDCHAYVSAKGWPGTGTQLPLRPADTADGLAAMSIHSDVPLDSQCPYIESIDGVPLAKWMAAASKFAPRGSPQFVRQKSLEWLGQIHLLRDELGLPAKATVMIGLRSADGVERCEKQLRLTGQDYSVARIRLQKTRKLDGNTGYLRIATMDDRIVDSTINDLRNFRDTDGLIIDVRDNGGGTYGLLRAIYGFFAAPDAKPYVTNVAAYRLSERFRDNHIAYRPTHRAGWDGWNDSERAAIQGAAAAFQPQWRPPDGKFSDWHYMVLSRERGGQSIDKYFFYNRPVIVLSNAGSFSATDGFLSAMADLPQVTLLGQPSGGGSGATRRFRLPNTQVTVALSSMASFRANGKLFDGNGIQVDVEEKATLQDYTTNGDSVLRRAVAMIGDGTK